MFATTGMPGVSLCPAGSSIPPAGSALPGPDSFRREPLTTIAQPAARNRFTAECVVDKPGAAPELGVPDNRSGEGWNGMSDVYLDSLSLLEAQVGFGDVGMHGTLGYEGKTVSVRQRHYAHSLSTHPPARLRFRVDRGFASFSCQVALNDDVPAGASHADFIVAADGHEVAIEPYVRAGEPPRMLRADISGAEYLEFMVRTSRWEYSHAVWLDPRVV